MSIHNQQLSTKVYRKPTDNPQYLHFHSMHPKHLKVSLPYSLALRCKRICSNSNDLLENQNLLKQRFKNRGYPEQIIDNAINKSMQQPNLIEEQSPRLESVNLITTFHDANPNFNSILKKNFNIISNSSHLKTLLSQPPKVVYRRAPNIKSLLVKSKINAQKINFVGSRGCCNNRLSRCQICKQIPHIKQFTSRDKSFNFEIRGNYDCDTPNAVYIFECTICNMQYVGETQNTFRERFNNHKSRFYTDIYHTDTCSHTSPLAAHYLNTKHHFNNLNAFVVKAGFSDHIERKCFESFLIHKLNSFNNGLNQCTGIWKKY